MSNGNFLETKRKLKVIIADDHNIIREGIVKLIESLNDEEIEIVGQAKNGEEAIDLFKKLSKKPDIIIMDHRMPIKSGLEASKEILQINNTTKIIFASADKTVKKQAMSIGAAGFLNKPFTNEKLLKKIDKVLNTKYQSS